MMKKIIRFFEIFDLILVNLSGVIIAISAVTAMVLAMNQNMLQASKEIYLAKLCWIAGISFFIFISSIISASKLEKIEAKMTYKKFLEITKNV